VNTPHPSLTPEERVKAAYFHFILGMDQALVAHVLATNSGRVAEACMAVKLAVENPKRTRELFDAANDVNGASVVALEEPSAPPLKLTHVADAKWKDEH
jgi:hypothetical protein